MSPGDDLYDDDSISYWVDITTAPVTDGNLGGHYRVQKAIPGTQLTQNGEGPVLSIPVDAQHALKATLYLASLPILDELDPLTCVAYPINDGYDPFDGEE